MALSCTRIALLKLLQRLSVIPCHWLPTKRSWAGSKVAYDLGDDTVAALACSDHKPDTLTTKMELVSAGGIQITCGVMFFGRLISKFTMNCYIVLLMLILSVH